MGTTPNRGYPYPDPSDPTTVAPDLQALAKAFDADLGAVQDGIHGRTMFRATASARQEYGPNAGCQVRFDVLEENVAGALLEPTTMPRDRFVPLVPGFWAFTATVSYPQWAGIGWVQLQLLSNSMVAETMATEMPTSVDGNRTISVTGAQEMSGTGAGNPIIVNFFANPAAGRPTYPIWSRSLTGFLLART